MTLGSLGDTEETGIGEVRSVGSRQEEERWRGTLALQGEGVPSQLEGGGRCPGQGAMGGFWGGAAREEGENPSHCWSPESCEGGVGTQPDT